ncbi:unnamed protein product, partial [Ixodes hexagonus]
MLNLRSHSSQSSLETRLHGHTLSRLAEQTFCFLTMVMSMLGIVGSSDCGRPLVRRFSRLNASPDEGGLVALTLTILVTRALYRSCVILCVSTTLETSGTKILYFLPSWTTIAHKVFMAC